MSTPDETSREPSRPPARSGRLVTAVLLGVVVAASLAAYVLRRCVLPEGP